MTAMTAMKESDVNEAADLHRRGVLNLRAATWALAVFRRQGNKELTPAEVMKRFGASKTNAYRVVSEMKFVMAMTHQKFPETGTAGEAEEAIQSPDSSHQIFPETGTGTHQSFPVSRIPGFPETGTKSPGNRDSTQYKGSIETESVCSSRPHAHARGEAGRAMPNGPSPEPEREAAVRFVDDLTAGALLPWASAAVRVYPAPWVRALAERKCIGGRGVPRAELLNSILQAWATAGSCEYLAGSEPPAIVPMRAAPGPSPFARPETPGAARLREQRERNRRLIEEAEARERAEGGNGPQPRSEAQR